MSATKRRQYPDPNNPAEKSLCTLIRLVSGLRAAGQSRADAYQLIRATRDNSTAFESQDERDTYYAHSLIALDLIYGVGFGSGNLAVADEMGCAYLERVS